MSDPASIFEFDGKQYLPTDAALGPWRPDGLHGGAVNALLARSLESKGYLIARLTMDMVRRVPREPLTITLGEENGSSRIRRQSAQLWAGETLVAQAQALKLLHRNVDVPDEAVEKQIWNPADVALPEQLTDQERQAGQKYVGYPSFTSHAIAVRFADGHFRKPGPVTVWIKLMLPVVAGEPLTPVQRAAAAADYASGANGILPFSQWSFMNADLTVHFSRPPVGDWIAVSSRVSSQKTGIGLGEAVLHDAVAPFGRSAQTLFIEPATR
ncbi:MAG TPA: hypothetical protein VIV27_06935 [Halioglobus sp.]